MASQEDLDLLKVEVELLKSRLVAAEELIRKQSSEIAALSSSVTSLGAINAKNPSPTKGTNKKPQNGGPTDRQLSATMPSPVRRSSVTLTSKPSTRAFVPKSATSTNVSASVTSAGNPENGTSRNDSRRLRTQPSATSTSRSSQKQRPSSSRHPTGAVVRSREATFDRDTSVLRLYLRGRAVTLPAPVSASDSFDIAKPVDIPAETLKLEWAYGFRGKSILLLPTGELVYAVAAVVVLLNEKDRSQRFYTEHTDDVKCLAIHPDRITVASGQVAGHDKEAGKPHVRIWNSVTLQTIRVLGLSNDGGFDRAVVSLSFSKADAGMLAAVDDSNEHVLSVWDWKSGHRLGDTRVSGDPVIGIDFNPTASSPSELATWGRFGLIWWTCTTQNQTGSSGATTVRITRLKQATFDAKDRPRAISCAVYSADGSLLIAGDSNGGLSWWTRGSTRMGRLLPGAHANGAVSSLFVSSDSEWLLSAGAKDHSVIKWNIRGEPPSQISKLQLWSGATVRAIQWSGSAFYFGTANGSILSTRSVDGESSSMLTPLIQGHSEEVWGVAVHPSKPIAVSVGYDRLLVLWDTTDRRSISAHELPSAGHSVAFHPNGNLVAIGLRTGEWIATDLSEDIAQNSPALGNAQPVKIIHSDHPAREQIECIAFSPNGHYLAVGSRDQHIYVYSVITDTTAAFSRVSRCSGHSSFITHLDWSADSKFLRSNSGDYELLFWEANTGRQILLGNASKDGEQLHSIEVIDMLREAQSWATQTCTLSFGVAGIWPDGADGTDINCAEKAHAKNLLAIGDDFGKVRLFRWPCPAPRSHSFIANGHSSHVTSARFLNDDSRIISSGGRDAAILQWAIVTA